MARQKEPCSVTFGELLTSRLISSMTGKTTPGLISLLTWLFSKREATVKFNSAQSMFRSDNDKTSDHLRRNFFKIFSRLVRSPATKYWKLYLFRIVARVVGESPGYTENYSKRHVRRWVADRCCNKILLNSTSVYNLKGVRLAHSSSWIDGKFS